VRIDKYLKLARLVKRRSVAKLLADHGKIIVNDKIAKPSTAITVGDIIKITFGEKELQVKVQAILKNPKKDDAFMMYEIID
jgi:ribosomal 50S subunit-recycling heat shock protein